MATTIVESSRELNQLFRDISSKFSPAESENVVKSSKRIYGKQFDSLENQDVLSCLGLLLKLGYVSNTKLTLIREFFAPMSNKGKDISETIDNFRASRPLQADLEKELQGRSEDFKEITDMLKTGQPAVVNLHGSSGVGKTTLAKAICSKWRGKSYVFDLREAKNMKAIYFHIMKNLGLTVPVGYLSFSYVVDRICEHTVKDSDGQPVLFLLDNVEQFTLGQGKEGKNLRTAFMQFLGKLSECDDSGTMRPLRVLLTSRTRLNDAQKVIDHELQPLKDSDSEKVLLPKEMSDLDKELKEKLVAICNRKPLFLKGVRAIFQQGRKAPNDLIDELEKMIHMANKEKADTPEKSKLEEDSKEKPFDLEKEGVDTSEQSVMKEMFSTLPSDNLKLSAVSISLFCGPFTAMTAAKVLGISQAEAVAQLEGLETSAIVFVVNREAKELMYDIHPLLKKYAESIKSGAKFAETYLKARERFYEHFMSEMKTIAGFIESDYVKAFNQFANDQPNFEFTIEISLLPEFFSVPGEFHDNALIASLVHAMLSTEKQRELFHSWAEICPDDEKSGMRFFFHNSYTCMFTT